MAIFKLHAPVESVAKVKQGLEKLRGALFQRPPLISAVKRQLRVRTVYDSKLLDYDETRNMGKLKFSTRICVVSFRTHLQQATIMQHNRIARLQPYSKCYSIKPPTELFFVSFSFLPVLPVGVLQTKIHIKRCFLG